MYRKILVADDDGVTRAFLKFNLKKAGFDVVTAQDGIEVTERLTDEISAVLLDIQMPRMDGMECLSYIQEHFPNLQPIMITANDDIADAVEAMKYGAFDYLIKPVNSNDLLTVLNRALRTFEQTNRLQKVEEELEKARDDEARVASKIQQTLLLGKPPYGFEGIQIARLTIPSQQIDGDFYDFFKISDHCLDLVVGDVMGKGIPAALLAAATKNHFLRVLYERTRSSTRRNIPEPEDIVTLVQSIMIDRLEDIENFLTLCYARFDLSQSYLSYVDCGHMRTIHHHKHTGRCTLLEGVNMPIGFPETRAFQKILYPFKSGDLFFFYSDGLTEAQDPFGNFYGEERLVETVQHYILSEPKEIINNVRKEILDFSHTDQLADDFTCVVLKINDANQNSI